MRYNRFFFGIILGLFCVNMACAMQLNSGNKNEAAIDMSHVWSDDYSQNISAIKEKDLKSVRSQLKSDYYLSPHVNAIDHLLYLSTIRKNNREKTPFTHKQQDKFDAAVKIKRSVPYCFAINGAVVACTAFIPFTNFTGLSQCVNATQSGCLSQVSTIIIPTVAAVAGALTVGFVSLYATGLSPDLSSRKADKVQDEIGHLSRKYATIAKYWIDIYFNCPEKAQYIADKFDIEELKLRAKQKTYKTKAGSDLVNPLEEAWHFITYNNILVTFTEIENYLYNKIQSKKTEALERRIESLEKIVHNKDAEIERLKQEHI